MKTFQALPKETGKSDLLNFLIIVLVNVEMINNETSVLISFFAIICLNNK